MQKDAVIAGRFELLTHAGKGGMASVYKALDRDTSRIVAVKILTLDRPFDIARFAREATVLATIRHPNVVEYIAHGQATGVHFLAQEWVDGDTLSAYQRSHGTTARDAVTIAIGVAAALEAIHTIGVIHRDVKPSNIILANGKPDGVKLVDFGIARAAAEAGVLTRSGVMLGTPSYMSPEQAQGLLSIESESDIWALGCVLFEALTGRTAFAGKTPAAIRAKVLLADPQALTPLCPEAPPELCTLVGHMLEKRESRRPANGTELLARLRSLPAIPDGPVRRVGVAEPSTLAMPVRPRADQQGAAN
ncbi:MAG TPA: serine/threonine-protein kinase, partial [Kofleriaceae bacterium]|nr:serine/threonine-protein kinase [Kofleriaceae bacterium]